MRCLPINKNRKQQMTTKYVRVSTPDKSFVIPSQDVKVMGKYPKQVQVTAEVQKAIGDGRLTELSAEEYERLMKELDEKRAEAKSKKATEKADTISPSFGDELGLKASQLAEKERELEAREKAIQEAAEDTARAKVAAEELAKKAAVEKK